MRTFSSIVRHESPHASRNVRRSNGPGFVKSTAVLAAAQTAGCTGLGIAGGVVGSLGLVYLGAAFGVPSVINAYHRRQWRKDALDFWRRGDFQEATKRFYLCRQCSELLPNARANAVTYAVYETLGCRRAGYPQLIDRTVMELSAAIRDEYPGTLLWAALMSPP